MRNTLALAILLVTATALFCSCDSQSIYPSKSINEDGMTVLYNGITLPEIWPPRYELPCEREEMPLPYIDNKPSPIIINIGRQLFVDDFLIEKTDMERICHKATMYEGNPILDEITYSDGVWYDETENKFKIWYYGKKNVGLYEWTSYAESEDGIHWNMDSQDAFPGTNTLQVYHGDSHIIWLDKMESDKSKRYKSICTCSPINSGYILQYSPDGLHWSDPVAQSGRVQDRSTAFYNPFTRKWVMSMRICALNPPSRARAYTEADDVETAIRQAHWVQDELDPVIKDTTVHYTMKEDKIVFWFTADDKDERHPFPEFSDTEPAIYNFDAIAYESVMLGQYAMWRGPENYRMEMANIWKLNEVGLGYSRDGFHFYRPDHSAFMGCNPQDSTVWNGGNMQAACGNPIIVGDSLYFYAGAHPKKFRDNNGRGTTGLYTLRRDGFVSMDASSKEGTLTTSPVTFDGKYLFVNAKAASLAVEILDNDGNVIDGFSKNECIMPKLINSTKHPVEWIGRKSLNSLKGKTVKFRFYVTDGSLYSFWISPWKTGESRGFTGGGGPGLHPSGVDIPL